MSLDAKSQSTRKRVPKLYRDAQTTQWQAGVHAGLPQLLAFQLERRLGNQDRVLLRLSPPLPIEAEVNMPSEVISTKGGIGVANPDFTADFDVKYGPYVDLGYLWDLGRESGLFFEFDLGYRRLTIDGVAQSGVLICSLEEAAKEPPCADPDKRIQTVTELKLAASGKSEAAYANVIVGNEWQPGKYRVKFLAGALVPFWSRRSTNVTANVVTAGDELASEVDGALAIVKALKEEELKENTAKELSRFDQQILPVLALSIGYAF